MAPSPIFARFFIMSTTTRVRLRFAPSPTGPLHMGGVRTALFNYLFAKQHGGDFLLRIEDTDQTRYVPGAEEYIQEALRWCGIEPNEGVGVGGPHAPYRQSERKELGIYRTYAMQLVESGNAYLAFDTPEELDQMRNTLQASGTAAPQYNAVTRQQMKNSLTLPPDEVNRLVAEGVPYVIRLKIPRNREIRLKDLIRGWVVVQSQTLDDKVLLKADGMPTYHLAHVVDDILMEISHVVRGEEWLPSAPAHVLIYEFLDKTDVMPQFAHLPLLLKPEGNGKLSKRDGDRLGFPVFPLEWKDPFSGEVSSGYREKGYISEAFVNMLALLGWNPGNNQEVMSREELIALFSFEKVSKAGARFDPEKARWFNQQYLRMQEPERLAASFLQTPEVKAVLEKHPEHVWLNNRKYVHSFCELIREKAQFVHEFWSLGSYFFTELETFDHALIEKKWQDAVPSFFSALADTWQALPEADAATLEQSFKSLAAEKGLTPGHFNQLIRLAVTGMGGGPQLFDLLALIGKERVCGRLKNFRQVNA